MKTTFSKILSSVLLVSLINCLSRWQPSPCRSRPGQELPVESPRPDRHGGSLGGGPVCRWASPTWWPSRRDAITAWH